MTRYWCERAWLGPDRIADGVLVETSGPLITRVETADQPGDAYRLRGLTVPGFANCHSHAFHRALRGRTQRDQGSFWTWRELMYAVADRLDPERYYDLALATYQEMMLAGITAVGEFHYLHHAAGGQRYEDPNAMGEALVAAARDAGLRIALLDACYLSSGFGAEVSGVQHRFSDGTAERWAERVDELRAAVTGDDVVVGAAIHSVRAVPADAFAIVGSALPDAPLHVHLSEQVAENDGCLEAYGRTPTQLLADHGVVSSRMSAVHATHLTPDDVVLLGGARAYAGFCPTTERDLADGIGPSRPLADAGARLTLGTDSHAVIDMGEEMRAVELDERLASQRRGHWSADDLLTAATATGHESLGFPRAGRIEPGAWADLVSFDVESVRTAGGGAGAEAAVFAATASDIRAVVASGRLVDLDPGQVAQRLAASVDRLAASAVEA